jgi:hypothetical protein
MSLFSWKQSEYSQKFVHLIDSRNGVEFTDQLAKILDERGDDIKDIKFARHAGGYSALIILNHRKVKDQLEKEKAGISE